MKYAIIENGAPRELGWREGLTIGGIQYPYNITELWAPEALAEMGIYPIVDLVPQPEGRWHDDVASSLVFEEGEVRRQWSGTYNEAKHIAAKKQDSRNQYEIPAIDLATGDERAKLTLIAAAVADMIQRLAQHDNAAFGSLVTHLSPWAEVIAAQHKGAAIEAALEANPNLDLAEAWAE